MAKNFVLLISLGLFLNVKADTGASFKELFNQGLYQKLEERLKELPYTKKDKATKLYYQGLMANRKQEYAKGVNLLKRAIRLGSKEQDIYYELGQAYYANNELEKAIKAFKRSYKKKYKPHVSLYYLGHIHQIFEQYQKSLKFYQRCLVTKGIDKDIQQITLFQIAEIQLAMTQKDSDVRSLVKKTVLPQLEKSIAVKPKSGLVKDIQKRIEELKRKYQLDPNIMINGRMAYPASTYLLSQSLAYDNNVTYSNELPTTVATQRNSFIFNTNVNATYNYIYDQRLTFRPNFILDYTKHANSDNADVYQYDSYSLYSIFKLLHDFSFLNDPASWQITGAHYYTARDWTQTKSIRTSGNTLSYEAGINVKLISLGESSLRYSSSSLSSYDPTLDSETISYSFSQGFKLGKYDQLSLFFQNSTTTVVEESYNTKGNLLRLDYMQLNRIPSINMQYSLSANQQKLTNDSDRGTELTLTAILKGTKMINNKLQYSVSYEYTDKNSNSDDYKYSKEVLTFELRLSY